MSVPKTERGYDAIVRRSTAGGRGSGLRRPVRSLLRSLHRFSAFQVAGRRSVSLAFSAGRRLVALRELLLVVQEHAAQRPPDVFGAGFVDVVSDRSPRRPALVWFNRAFGGLSLLGDRFRGGHALAPPASRPWCPGRQARLAGARRRRGNASRRGARGAREPPSGAVRSGCLRSGGSVRPSRFRPATDTRGGRACRPGGEGSVSSCPLFQSEPVIGTGRGERISVIVAFDPRIAVIRDPRLRSGSNGWSGGIQARGRRPSGRRGAPAGVCSLIQRTASEVIRNHRLVAVRGELGAEPEGVTVRFSAGVAQRQGSSAAGPVLARPLDDGCRSVAGSWFLRTALRAP